MKPKILIVDDEPAIRRTFREIFEFEYYDVDTAEDGLDCMLKIKKSSYEYNVIILDIKMPKMDGLKALELIKSQKPHIPVIIISGHADIETATATIKKGAFDFVSKPPDIYKMTNIVKDAIEYNWAKYKNYRYVKNIGDSYSYIDVSSPEKFITPFYQYLVYFKEYLITTKGIALKITLNETSNGLRIIIHDERYLHKIQNWINEYLGFLQTEDIENEILFESETAKERKNMIFFDIKRQLNFFNDSINWIRAKEDINEVSEVNSGFENQIVDYSKVDQVELDTTSTTEYRIKIKKLIANGKTLEAIEKLINQALGSSRKDKLNQYILIQSELNKLIKDIGLGKITRDYEQAKTNEINNRLLNLIDNAELNSTKKKRINAKLITSENNDSKSDKPSNLTKNKNSDDKETKELTSYFESLTSYFKSKNLKSKLSILIVDTDKDNGNSFSLQLFLNKLENYISYSFFQETGSITNKINNTKIDLLILNPTLIDLQEVEILVDFIEKGGNKIQIIFVVPQNFNYSSIDYIKINNKITGIIFKPYSSYHLLKELAKVLPS